VEESQNDRQMPVYDAGDKKLNVPVRSHAMVVASGTFLSVYVCLIAASSTRYMYANLDRKLCCIFNDRDQKILVTRG
jgi:hypothetical protein